MLMARLSPHPVIRADISPPLSLIIAVYNGEKFLRQKLEYAGALEIIVASDGSTDGTDTIAESFAELGVRLVALDSRAGKEAAQAAAIAKATGEILVFTDVSAELEPEALAAIVRPLGCYTGAGAGGLNRLARSRSIRVANSEQTNISSSRAVIAASFTFGIAPIAEPAFWAVWIRISIVYSDV